MQSVGWNEQIAVNEIGAKHLDLSAESYGHKFGKSD